MMIVDSILSAGRASSQATEQLLRGLMSLDVWFQVPLKPYMGQSGKVVTWWVSQAVRAQEIMGKQ